MPCSFCHFAGHTVTTCQSTVLLELMRKTTKFASVCQTMPIKFWHSNAGSLVKYLDKLSVNELKGIAAKCLIKLNKLNKNQLKCSIAMSLYYDNIEPDRFGLLNDSLYYTHLRRCISGFMTEGDSRVEYATIYSDNIEVIKEETRRYNIGMLIGFASINSESLLNVTNNIRSTIFRGMVLEPNNWIQNTFGMYVTELDLRIRIPIVYELYDNVLMNQLVNIVRSDTREFVDVVNKQKLSIHCEYKQDAVCEETAEECIICCDNVKTNTVLNCGHMFCVGCVSTTVEMVANDHRMRAKCPACREEMKHIRSTDFEKINKLSEYIA